MNFDRPIISAALNHIESIREATYASLDGLAIRSCNKSEWLRRQSLEPFTWPGQDAGSSDRLGMINQTADQFRRERLNSLSLSEATLSSSAVNPEAKEHGQHRSSAGWQRGDLFCISSAYIRALGAMEQMELDVLKALFYYRPSGLLGHPADQQLRCVEFAVIEEKPDKDGKFQKPVLWTWLGRTAENRTQRNRIFEHVFGIELAPGGTNRERTKTREYRESAYRTRNALAHGRHEVELTFREYLELDCFVVRCMLHLMNECEEKQKLRI